MLETIILESSFGLWKIEGSELGVRRIMHVEEKTPATAADEVPSSLKPAYYQLQAYFQGDTTSFDLELDLSGHSEFYKQVWSELKKVPYGHTTSYLSIAQVLGDRKAVRAVGQANRNNPIAIIIPCHRCIAQNGDLQGYFYGLDFKSRLLAHENPMSFAQQGKLF